MGEKFRQMWPLPVHGDSIMRTHSGVSGSQRHRVITTDEQYGNSNQRRKERKFDSNTPPNAVNELQSVHNGNQIPLATSHPTLRSEIGYRRKNLAE